jgi:hypothetical protein
MDSSQRSFIYDGNTLWCQRWKCVLYFEFDDVHRWIRRYDAVYHLSNSGGNATNLRWRSGNHKHGRIQRRWHRLLGFRIIISWRGRRRSHGYSACTIHAKRSTCCGRRRGWRF